VDGSREQARRRRLTLAIGFALLAAAGAVVAVTTMGGGTRKPATSSVATHARASRRPRTAPHRAAAPVPAPAAPVAVPILVYHVIAPPFANSPYPGLYVPPAEFNAQMTALHRAGYHAVTLDQVLRSWRTRTALPPRPVVISFDNGYRTQYTVALPVLRRFGWVGVENIQLSGLPPSQGGLSPKQVRGLVAAGWELDTQGWSHADLPALDPAELRFQVAVARARLRRAYGTPVNWFCYPSGHYDDAVVAAVRRAGFVGATTILPGWAANGDNRYRLPRLRVLGGTAPAQLIAQIASSHREPPPPRSYGA
jgi:peptidoglycan/xylan/chitin deacetylase (PgdA/CDA1 family)